MNHSARVLIIEDNRTHANKWIDHLKKHDFNCTAIIAANADDAIQQLEAVVGESDVMFDVTIVDVMFGRDESHGGIVAMERAAALYDISRFGLIVVASSIEIADDIVNKFVGKFKAYRCAAPLSHSMERQIEEIIRRIDKGSS